MLKMKSIGKGDLCEFPVWALGERSRKLDIVWRQDGDFRKELYTLILVDYPVSGLDSTAEKGRARLFIAEDKLSSFKSMLESSKSGDIDTFRVKITNDFLYGQADSTGKDRFLVLHDKERNPYQHRFVPSQFVKFGEGSLKKLKKAGYGSEALDLVDEYSKAVIGDDLLDFSGVPRKKTGLAALAAEFFKDD